MPADKQFLLSLVPLERFFLVTLSSDDVHEGSSGIVSVIIHPFIKLDYLFD